MWQASRLYVVACVMIKIVNFWLRQILALYNLVSMMILFQYDGSDYVSCTTSYQRVQWRIQSMTSSLLLLSFLSSIYTLREYILTVLGHLILTITSPPSAYFINSQNPHPRATFLSTLKASTKHHFLWPFRSPFSIPRTLITFDFFQSTFFEFFTLPFQNAVLIIFSLRFQ